MNLIGVVLGGRYEIAEKLGAGGMAIVYRAQDTLLQRPVTVKVLRGELAADDNVVRRFRREAQAAASLSHPNIVGVYDVGRQDEIHYIVMEYIEGKTLKEEITERGPLQPEEAVRVGRQICEALRHAHAHHIIHRDVKPHNVLITPEGRIKIGDFGIAGAATGGTVTYPGALLGTVYYFSPEQAQGRYGDERSDLYALGVVLYEMLTGRVPFEGESPVSVALKHIREAAPSPRELNPRVSPAAERVVMKAMTKEAERRYQTAAEMLRDLDALQRQLAEWRAARGQPAAPGNGRDRTQVIGVSPPKTEIGQSTLPGVKPGRATGWWTPRQTGADASAAAATSESDVGERGSGARTAPPGAGSPDELGGGGGASPGLARGQGAGGGGRGGEDDGLGGGGDYLELENAPGARSRTRRRWSRTTIWIASFTAFLVLIAIGLFLVVQWFEVPEVSVPNVVGLNVIDAASRLEQYQLHSRIVSQDYNSVVPVGQVVDQDPDAGVPVKSNRTVSLWVSKGPELVAEVPDVIGLTWREAKISLESLGLTVEEADFTYAKNEAIAKDRVIRQNPRSGTQNLPTGTKVYLVVSLGPQAGTVTVPNFVGQTLTVARAELPDLQLVEGTITTTESSQPDGTILEQNPAPGSQVTAGTGVSFTVAGSGGSDPGGGSGQQHTERVSITVPSSGSATQNVRIVVTDSQGERTVYDHDHVAGYEGKIDVTWTGATLRVQIYYSGTLSEDYTVNS